VAALFRLGFRASSRAGDGQKRQEAKTIEKLDYQTWTQAESVEAPSRNSNRTSPAIRILPPSPFCRSRPLFVGQAQTLTREDVVHSLTGFEPIWESLTVREQSRIVQLIVKQVDYDGSTGRVTITFHPDGIKAIAMERRPELHGAAS